MPTYTITYAAAHLDALIDRAGRGEVVEIAPAGGPPIRLVPVPPRRIDVDELRTALNKQRKQDISTAEIVRQERDERY